MDVKDLAPALLAIDSLLEEANRILNKGRARTAVQVRTFSPGSIEVALDVSLKLSELFSWEDVENARSILKLLAYGATKRPRLANRRNKVGASGCSPSSLRECPTLCASSYSRPLAG